MRKYALTLVLCFPFFSSPLLSQVYQDDAGDWELSGFIGAAATTDDDSITPVEGGTSLGVGLDFDHGLAGGARITQNLTDHFGGEVEYAVSNQPGALTNPTPTVTRFDFSHKIHTVTYNALLYPAGRMENAQPFLTAGIGVSFFQTGTNSERDARQLNIPLDDQLKFAFAFGGGVKVPVSPLWGLRFDVRDYVTGVPDFDLPPEAPLLPGGGNGAGFRAEGVLHSVQATIGIFFYLDGR